MLFLLAGLVVSLAFVFLAFATAEERRFRRAGK
jgi:hypothetical protein